jgi:putative ABC transport system permease protein
MSGNYRKPPRILQNLLKFISKPEEHFSVVGDFEEIYNDIIEEKGFLAALHWYSWQIVKSLPLGITQRITWSFIMFKNYLKIAFRTISKKKVISLTNIIGFAISVSFFILIFLFIQNESTYDYFHQNKENIYKVYLISNNKGVISLSGRTYPTNGIEIKNKYPNVEDYVRFGRKKAALKNGNQFFKENITFADASIFKIFTFPMKYGSNGYNQDELHTVILSEEVALKYFGIENPIGKVISIQLNDEYYDFSVKDVAQNIPSNSSIKFDILLPFDNLNKGFMNPNSIYYTFVLLKEKTDYKNVTDYTSFMGRSLDNTDYWTKYSLQPLSEVHFNRKVPGSLEPQGNVNYSYILSGLAFLILTIASINFINLSIAQSSKRFKEVGIRKIIGAQRFHILKQLWGETTLLILISSCLGILFAGLLLPAFNTLTQIKLTIDFIGSIETYVFLTYTIIVITIICGSYPAYIISKFNPIDTLKGKFSVSGFSKTSKVLLVIQYSLTIFLICIAMIMYSQFKYLIKKDLGFVDDDIIVLQLHNNNGNELFDKLKDEILTNPNIKNISATDFGIGNRYNITQSWNFELYDNNQKLFVPFIHVDNEFINTLRLTVIEGRGFKNNYDDKEINGAIIINEALQKELELEMAEGTRIKFKGNKQGIIIGVVKNFHFMDVKNIIKPVALSLNGLTYKNIYFKIDGENIRETTEFLRKKFATVAPEEPFDYEFLDEDINKQLAKDMRYGLVMTCASGYAIIIACLGLFGISSIIIVNRKKEIGIRKVLGANILKILNLINKDFIMLILLANIIALPFINYVMKTWLEDFAYKIKISPLHFLLTACVVLFLSILIVSFHSIAATRQNSVDTLRTE